MFNPDRYKAMYRRILDPLSQNIRLAPGTGSGFSVYPEQLAFVSSYKEDELIPGGSIELGDLKVILFTDDIPAGIESLGRKDRIIIDNRFYSVIHWDAYTRTVGPVGIAVEITVRGGGIYVPAVDTYYLVTEDDDYLITEDNDQIVSEAA